MKEMNIILEWTTIEGNTCELNSFVFTDRKEVRK